MAGLELESSMTTLAGRYMHVDPVDPDDLIYEPATPVFETRRLAPRRFFGPPRTTL